VIVRCLTLAAAGLVSAGCLRQVDRSTATPALDLTPCSLPRVTRPAQCGTLEVAENRQRPSRTIGLRVVVVRAEDASAETAVFFLTGGPGTGATASAGLLTRQLADLSETHDFVFVDQRGTGASNPLPCEADDTGGLRPIFQAGLAARCREVLQKSADLTAYTTTDAVADLEAVRRALGYARIDLHGSSYGTRVAWAYAAQFPSHARTLVLHGPAPPGFIIPLPFGQGLETALAGVVSDCLADAACATRFPRLTQQVAAAFERLQSGPARVTFAGGREGELSHGELAEAVRYLLYSPTDARRVPLLLSQAAGGEYSPIARAAENYRRGLMRTLNMGMYLSVTCAEDIPFITGSAADHAPNGSRLGDYRVRQQLAACSEWPQRPAPADRSGTILRTPALLLVGAYDPATPLEWARRGAALLPESRVVVIPHGAHTFTGLNIDGCLSRMITGFIREGSAATLDDACVAEAKRPPFLLQ
jgi:pimeloyl-ACP methyl ester carboxylesterase